MNGRRSHNLIRWENTGLRTCILASVLPITSHSFMAKAFTHSKPVSSSINEEIQWPVFIFIGLFSESNKIIFVTVLWKITVLKNVKNCVKNVLKNHLFNDDMWLGVIHDMFEDELKTTGPGILGVCWKQIALIGGLWEDFE